MDVLEAIHTRRSIRKFTSKPISEEQVHAMLSAAMTAPSAGNAQPWRFLVIDDRATLDQLATIHPYVAMLKTATLAILVIADPGFEKYPGYWPIDCSAAVQNLLLAAHGLGLGAVWTGVYPMEERMVACREQLGIPQDLIPHSLIPIGYPDQPSVYKNRYKEDRVRRNHW
ncbi:nitroreductase family protein [Desulfovibrio inopinatus]|uniref:nitroreductase family protein n=1 Tax=Desulfovibrio inopinatus TaxID=102109 RepID=UPI00040D7B43|nr:nitroreductase family protein [Desulfovibrio inopinatus]